MWLCLGHLEEKRNCDRVALCTDKTHEQRQLFFYSRLKEQEQSCSWTGHFIQYFIRTQRTLGKSTCVPSNTNVTLKPSQTKFSRAGWCYFVLVRENIFLCRWQSMLDLCGQEIKGLHWKSISEIFFFQLVSLLSIKCLDEMLNSDYLKHTWRFVKPSFYCQLRFQWPYICTIWHFENTFYQKKKQKPFAKRA